MGLGIEYIGQLVLLKGNDLLRVPAFGERTLKKIKEALGELDLDLGLDEPEWGMLDADEITTEFYPEIKAAASWLARKRRPPGINYLEDELVQLLSVIDNNRYREIFAQRYGINGNRPLSLQHIGDNFGGLTRERIRQITYRCGRMISQRSWHLPIFDKAINLIFNRVPCSDQELRQELRENGVCRGDFSIEGIVATALVLGKPLTIFTGGKGFSNVWLREGDGNIAKKVLSLAKKMMSTFGLVTFDFLVDEIDRLEGVKITKGFVQTIVEVQPQFRILDLVSGWFWFHTNRNRLLNVLRKIFSVADRVHVSEVRLAIQRFRRLNGFAPPQRVILSFCNLLPEFGVDESFILRAPGVSADGWIEGVEQLFAAVLAENGGMLDRIRLEEECLKRGMNIHTFIIYLYTTPILLQLGRGVFGLVGADTTADQIASMELKRSNFKAVTHYEWLPNGNMRIEYRVTDSMLYMGFFPVPRPICEYLDGPFGLVDSDGDTLGTLKIKAEKHMGWNLKRLFRNRGGDEGDPFALTFNLTDKIAVIEYGNQETVGFT